MFSYFINLKNYLKNSIFVIPKNIFFIFIFSIIIMNILASITVINSKYLVVTGGIFFSFIPFLIMDATTNYFGPKISSKLTFLGLICNLIFILFLKISYFIFFSKLNFVIKNNIFYSIFNNSLPVIISSSIAFLLSGIINNYINYFLKYFFKKDKNEKLEFFTRSYVSTFLGQFIDNFCFIFLLYNVFFPILNGFAMINTFSLASGAFLGASLELFTEIIFSPIGYNLTIKWRKENLKQTLA